MQLTNIDASATSMPCRAVAVADAVAEAAKRASVCVAACVALVSAPLSAQTNDYPNRQVRVIVAFTAGGTTDILARGVSQKLTERMKQPFIVDNRPGGGGNIGTELAARAAPDGYTLIVDSVGPIAVNPTLYRKLNINPLVDLVPIVQIADVPNVLVVHPSIPANTLDEFVAYGKAGFFAPKGTPPIVITELNKAVNEVLPSLEAQMIREGADPVGGTPLQFAQFVQKEYEKWKVIVQDSKATAE